VFNTKTLNVSHDRPPFIVRKRKKCKVCDRRQTLTGSTVRDDIDPPSAAIKLDLAVHKGEYGEIVADSGAPTGMEPSADLSNENVPRPNRFTAKLFDSPSLTVGIPTIPAGPLTLFMRHCS